MSSNETPASEEARLHAVRALGLLYTPAEERFDRITRIASRVLDVPIALISLIAEDETWFKSRRGLAVAATPRTSTFCAQSLVENQTLVIEDTFADKRFSTNPFVLGEPKIRFYAGTPVRAQRHAVGTLCVLDTHPRRFSEADLQILKDLAGLVETEFERGELSESRAVLLAQRNDLERKAMIDGLTRLWNRSAIVEVLAKEVARARRGLPLTVAMIDIDNFKQINDTYGHAAGDHVLREVAARLRGAVRESDTIGRYGGEEFLAVLGGCGFDDAPTSAERMRHGVAQDAIVLICGELNVTVSIGFATSDSQSPDAERLLHAADVALYQAKALGRNRIFSAENLERSA